MPLAKTKLKTLQVCRIAIKLWRGSRAKAQHWRYLEMKETWKFLWQMAILAGLFWGSDWLVRATGLPMPGNVLGIVVLFLLLLTGIVKEDHVSTAANFLLKHMVFFFVPVAVGLMQWGGVFYDYGWILLVAIVVGAVLPLLTVGLLGRALRCRARRREGESCNPM